MTYPRSHGPQTEQGLENGSWDSCHLCFPISDAVGFKSRSIYWDPTLQADRL